ALVVLTGQLAKDLAITQRLARGPRLPEPPRLQHAHLIDEPCAPHLIHPLCDPTIEPVAWSIETELQHAGKCVGVAGKAGTERLPGDRDDLDGPYDPAPVAGQDVSSGLRIEHRQAVMKRRGSPFGQFPLELGAQA